MPAGRRKGLDYDRRDWATSFAGTHTPLPHTILHMSCTARQGENTGETADASSVYALLPDSVGRGGGPLGPASASGKRQPAWLARHRWQRRRRWQGKKTSALWASGVLGFGRDYALLHYSCSFRTRCGRSEKQRGIRRICGCAWEELVLLAGVYRCAANACAFIAHLSFAGVAISISAG